MEAIPVWLQTIGYMIPLIISVGSAIFIYKKDKASIKKTGAETIEIIADSDRQDSKLSLDWALQFKARMDNLENMHVVDREKIVSLQTQINDLTITNTNQNARIIKLEKERKALLTEITNLRDRIRELEDENKRLREN
jgi:hypothetical protein